MALLSDNPSPKLNKTSTHLSSHSFGPDVTRLIFKKFICIFIMHMFEWAYLYMNVCAHRGQKKASELPGARVTGIYEPPEVGAEGQTWVLWETSA